MFTSIGLFIPLQVIMIPLAVLVRDKYGRRVFWAKGYYESTVGANKKAIEKYIREQEMEDQMADQLSFKEYEDPFKHIEEDTGE